MADPKEKPKDDGKNKPEGELKDGKTIVNEVDLGSEQTRSEAEAAQQKRSDDNEEGHALNMKKIEDAHKEHDPFKPDPSLGREDNSNTPIIDPKTGAKHWPQQRIAGTHGKK